MTNEELINTINRIRIKSIGLEDGSLVNNLTNKISANELKNEDSILGSFLQDEFKPGSNLSSFLIGGYFHTLENQLIYKTIGNILCMYNYCRPTTIETVSNKLIDYGILEEAGGIEQLVYLKKCTLSKKQFDFINTKIATSSILFCKEIISKANRKLINGVNKIILRSIILKDNTSINKTSTEDLKVENAILGYYLKNSHTIRHANLTVLRFLINGTFLSLKNQLIFDVMMKLYNTSRSINCTTVIKELESDKTLKAVGGLKYIEKLKNSALSEKQHRLLDSNVIGNKIIYSPNTISQYPFITID